MKRHSKDIAGGTVDPGFRRDDGRRVRKRGAMLRGLRPVALFLLAGLTSTPALAGEAPQCARGDMVLWGDGRHDDTAALNAWLRGDTLVWAESGEPVGPVIADHTFRLSAAVYAVGGTGRTLERFRLVWPERGETVSGGTVISADDPDAAPVVSGVTIVGGDPGEGVPFDSPDIVPTARSDPARCAIS
jgi:hypothetical protein